MEDDATPAKVRPNDGLGAWVPTADTARLPPENTPVWVYENGDCYIACLVYDQAWLWAKCYVLSYLDHEGKWACVDGELDDEYLPTLWQPLPEPPRYTQEALDAAKVEAASIAAGLRVE